MDPTALVFEHAILSLPGILGILVALGSLAGFVVKREGGDTLRLSLLVGVLMGVVLLAVAVIQARSSLDASLPVNSMLEPPATTRPVGDRAIASHC